MTKPKQVVIIVTALSLAAAAWAERKAPEKNPPRVTLDLVDGSHINGVPNSEAVPVHTTGTHLSIPLEKLSSIKFRDDRETAFFHFLNGDRITGVMGLEKIRLRTVFGEITVGTEHIDSLIISPRLPGETRVEFPILASAKITDNPYGMFCVADFNHDGRLDIAVSDKTKGSESIDIYLNSGDGTLIEKASYPVGYYPQHVAAGDFDEDGNLDLIVPVYLGELGDGTMRLFKGRGDGTFTMGAGFSAKVRGKGLHPNRLALGDLNKDDHLDFVVEMGNDWAINVHHGKGDGTFIPMHTGANGQNPGNTKIAHLDDDGWPDIVSGSQYTSLFVHLSDGDGGFRQPVQYLKGTTRRQPIIVGDLDGDQDNDILCAHATERYASIMINDGKGRFAESGRIKFPAGVGLSEIADFNRDGKMDFVLSSGQELLIVPGRGDGTFEAPVRYDLGHRIGGLQLHDLNDDGRLDLVYIDRDNNKVMMRQNALQAVPRMRKEVQQRDSDDRSSRRVPLTPQLSDQLRAPASRQVR